MAGALSCRSRFGREGGMEGGTNFGDGPRLAVPAYLKSVPEKKTLCVPEKKILCAPLVSTVTFLVGRIPLFFVRCPDPSPGYSRKKTLVFVFWRPNE